MSARVLVHPAAMLGESANVLAATLAAHDLADAAVFDHPQRQVRRGGKLKTVSVYEVVRPVPALPGVFARMDGVVFSTNPLLA